MYCLVTGATSGIGKETARALARSGKHIVMVGRNPARGSAALAEVRADARGDVDLLLADLSSLAQVRRLAASIIERYPRLDTVISNAGVFTLRRRVTADGFELMLGVNHLAPFLLINLLLPLLSESAPSRIVVVASGAHHGATLERTNLQLERGFNAWRGYSRSKLANVMFTYALARRLEGSGVTANSLHPGFVSTNLGSGNGIPVRPVYWLMRPFTITPARAAEAVVHLASDAGVDGVSGRYFERMKPARSSSHSLDAGAQEWLWEESTRLTSRA